MIKGTVKFFEEKKGYGFIAGDNGKDYFFHWSDIQADVSIFQKLSDWE